MSTQQKNCDHFQMDIMRMVDEELPEDKKRVVTQHLENCDDCRAVYQELTSIKEETMTLRFFLQPDVEWQDYWAGLYHRVERGLGWILFSAGAIFLTCFAIFQALSQLWKDAQLPGYIELAIYAVIFGAVILIISVVREKLSIRKTDKYRSVSQ